MKISELINQLSHIEENYGDIECQVQDKDTNGISNFIVIVDEYMDDGSVVNIRTWRY